MRRKEGSEGEGKKEVRGREGRKGEMEVRGREGRKEKKGRNYFKCEYK